MTGERKSEDVVNITLKTPLGMISMDQASKRIADKLDEAARIAEDNLMIASAHNLRAMANQWRKPIPIPSFKPLVGTQGEKK